MTDPSGDKDRPAADPTVAYDPPPPAGPASYEPENYDPPSPDATISATTPAGDASTPADTTAAAPTQAAESPATGASTPAAGSPATEAPAQAAEFPSPAPEAQTAGDRTPATGFPAQAAADQPGHLPPGAYETPAAYIPGTPYAPPGQPIPQAYPQQPYPPAYGRAYTGPAPYSQPYGTPPRGQDNALAIGALVCSILGFCSGITAIAGLVMGHIALSKTNRGEAGGRGLATAAVIVGYVVLALWAGFLTTLIILGSNGYLSS
ncbi:DUF4190 domain-containing protein [Amycolatopsis sp. A133]|uniref:DUF4190 domain-containing protein n=1 Tax=Amycolatopsis sp. A133 TaxID=3064472 RepID=UPI0027FCFDB6|nr:DUF4190 domain-containing protein [Amycolatopsis sp. A133]MDQ7802179.1 DUF4190 domain-containing protein [Amycolatopsis sp. A133]